MRPALHRALWVFTLCAALCGSFWLGHRLAPVRVEGTTQTASAGTVAAIAAAADHTEPTALYAHNLLLQQAPHFRVYVRWIRGQMLRTRPDQNPSFDVPASFVLQVEKGVVAVKLNDLADFLNSGSAGKMPLSKITLQNNDGHILLRGTVHKVIPIPVQLEGVLAPLPDGRLRYHLLKLSVLKLPLKGLFGMLHVKLSDLIHSGTPGMESSENDVFFDTQRILPPPQVRGTITDVIVSDTDLQVIYGGARNDEGRLARWHNFLRLTGGSLEFGKLTMHHADLTMIDASQDPWFDLDLPNYQAQLVYGTTRMTSKAGLEIYMPDLENLPARQSAEGVTLEWLRNRKSNVPALDLGGQH